MTQNYLSILIDSLRQKSTLLDELHELNAKQGESLTKDNPDLELFDSYIERKDEILSRLNQLDEGFELVYAGVSDTLKNDKERYATEIRQIQDLIKGVTEKSITLQAQEQRNKSLVETLFAKKRRQIKDGRRGSTAAYNYYKVQSGSSYTESVFVDKKN